MMEKYEDEFDSIIEFINAGKEFTLLTHISPDGDTIGSALAVYMLLVKCGKTAEIVCSNSMPKIYTFLPCADKVVLPEVAKGYKNVLAIDCADAPRFGRAIYFFDNAESTAALDHHITNPHFSGRNLVVPDASATAEIVYELYKRMDMPVSADVAECLYAGIITDTGNLSYSNTTPNALRIIADFLEQGLDISELNRKIYRTTSYARTRLQGFVASRIQLECDGEIGYAVLTRAQMLSFDASNEDCEGIVDCVRDVDCVKIAIFIREGSDGSFKVSLRSKDIGDVGRIANNFGGGGHARAAGYTAWESLSTVIANAIEVSVKELNNCRESEKE